MSGPAARLRAIIDAMDRELAFEALVRLVAGYGWLAGRSAEDVVPLVRSACYKEELRGGVDSPE